MKNNLSALLCVLALLPGIAHAATTIDGSQLSAWWGIPFAGMLLSIAFVPLLAPQFWHHHFGKVAIGWSLAFLLPCIVFLSPATAVTGILHALTDEYIPFIILLTALFV
ncbi:MAG: sodium:proton antiporter, partial [Oxalobacteraceae bacterium]